MFQALHSFEEHKAPASQIGLILGFSGKSPHAPLNSEIGRYAKRIAERFDISFSERSQRKYRYWDLFFRGWHEGRFFIWQLRPELVKAMHSTGSTGETPLPDEVREDAQATFIEGLKRSVMVNAYERNPVARRRCLEHWGLACMVCDLHFKDVYGEIGRDFIHVHHVVPISQVGPKRQVNPITDLRPVCPNCHAMLHRQNPPLSVEQLQKIMVEMR